MVDLAICSSYISPLEFSDLLSFILKTIANSNRQIRRPCAAAANEFIRLISLINSYLAFSFFLFSKTTLLQLGVYRVLPSFSNVPRGWASGIIAQGGGGGGEKNRGTVITSLR